MKKILIPTDFSELSDFAIDFGLDLAHNAISEVLIAHFVDTEMDPDFALANDIDQTDFLFSQLSDDQKSEIHKLRDRFADSDIKVTVTVYGNGFLNGIQDFVKRNNVDLVVIGTSGQESFQEFFSGNHAEQLIEHLRVPVISLKDPVKMEDIKNVVLGLDIQEEPYQPWKMLHLTKRVLECFDSKVHLVNIVPHKSAYHEEVRIKLGDIAEELGLEKYQVNVIEHRNDFSGLVQFADKVDARMICVFTHARPGLYRFFQRSFANDLTMVSDMPVLVVNKRNVTKLDLT
ncbi:MAG: universal stress protein [Cyclobacteriaceae bacterium]